MRNPPNFKLVAVKPNMNVKADFDIKTLDLGSTKTIGTIKIKKESLQPLDVKPSLRILNSLPKAAPAGPPGPQVLPVHVAPPTPKADVFGTINEIEDILGNLDSF